MVKIKVVLGALLLLSNSIAHALLIDFNTLSSSGGFTSLTTQGFVFTSNPTSTGTTAMVIVGGCSPPCPDNGTNYLLHNDFGDLQLHSITLSSVTGDPFSFISFDAGERNMGLLHAETLEITGVKADGSSVIASYNIDGINDGPGPLEDFQSFVLPSSFDNLVSVTFLGLVDPASGNLTQGYSLDNLLVTPSANAAVLFDNGDFSGTQVVRNNACGSFNDDGIGCRTTFTIYDNFVLSGDSVINSIVWHQTEQNPQNYLSTRITIFDGIPSDSTLIHTSEFVADRTLSLIVLPDPKFPSIPDPSYESLASVSGLNIALPAGTYWLGIHNEWRSSGASQWSQTTGNPTTIPGRYQGESTNCGTGIIGPGGGCLNFYSNENSAFKVIGNRTNVVDIDIKPGSDPNSINPRSNGVIPVAVLGSTDFLATDVDVLTVTFGPDGASPAHNGHVEDVNDDGYMDMIFHFRTQETGIVCGYTEATLTGKLYDGTPITGTDSVNTVGCKGNGNSAEKVDETSSSAGAVSWILLLGLGVVGLWRQNGRQ